MATINSYVIYCHNIISRGGKPMKKDLYMMELHKKLSEPHLAYRLENTPNMKRDLRKIISELLGKEDGRSKSRSKSIGKSSGPKKILPYLSNSKEKNDHNVLPEVQKSNLWRTYNKSVF